MVVGDSWFASFDTAKALKQELGLYFVGNIKTGHAHFPMEQMRWDLTHTERGDHTVYRLMESPLVCHAVAWSDYHYKTFICTAGRLKWGLWRSGSGTSWMELYFGRKSSGAR